MKKIFTITTLLILSVLKLSAQSDDTFYLDVAKEKLAAGECEVAQDYYNAYKILADVSIPSLEQQIEECINKQQDAQETPKPNYKEPSLGQRPVTNSESFEDKQESTWNQFENAHDKIWQEFDTRQRETWGTGNYSDSLSKTNELHLCPKCHEEAKSDNTYYAAYGIGRGKNLTLATQKASQSAQMELIRLIGDKEFYTSYIEKVCQETNMDINGSYIVCITLRYPKNKIKENK